MVEATRVLFTHGGSDGATSIAGQLSRNARPGGIQDVGSSRYSSFISIYPKCNPFSLYFHAKLPHISNP